ncbi:hypothetical protein [Fundicoccus culcitae]|uniref:Uncharacterized protein n=1 Tax=Fundicoccus culcitae TaxID=2969821 RepID=A0ABY5P6H2_9LACT|nr:hypothetical protein [Fundicoccus culcitae]UUX34342.1 hypothetical protein NRE15_01450 [Fundicoccus culcitae]
MVASKKKFFILYLVCAFILSGCFPTDKRATIINEEEEIDSLQVLDEHVDLQLTDKVKIQGTVNIDFSQEFYNYQTNYYQFTKDDLMIIDSVLATDGEVYREEHNDFFYELYQLNDSKASIYPAILDYSKIGREWNFLVTSLLQVDNIYNLSSFDSDPYDLEQVTIAHAIKQANEVIEKLSLETMGDPQVFTLDFNILSEINQLRLKVKTELDQFDEHDQGQLLVYQLGIEGIPMGNGSFSLDNDGVFPYNGSNMIFIYTEDGLTWLSIDDAFARPVEKEEITNHISFEELQSLIIQEYGQIIGINAIVIDDIRIALLPEIKNIENFSFELKPYYQVRIISERSSGDKESTIMTIDYYSLSNGERYK